MSRFLSFIQRLICRHRHQIIKRNLGQAWWECTTCFRVKPIPPILTGSPKGAFTPRALHVSNAVYHAWKVRQNVLSEKAQEELEDWYREQDEE